MCPIWDQHFGQCMAIGQATIYIKMIWIHMWLKAFLKWNTLQCFIYSRLSWIQWSSFYVFVFTHTKVLGTLKTESALAALEFDMTDKEFKDYTSNKYTSFKPVPGLIPIQQANRCHYGGCIWEVHALYLKISSIILVITLNLQGYHKSSTVGSTNLTNFPKRFLVSVYMNLELEWFSQHHWTCKAWQVLKSK